LVNPLKILSRWLRKKTVRTHLESFMAENRTEKNVLDIGCGESRYSHYFPNRLGVDFTRKKGVNVLADAHALPFQSSYFSMALSTEMLEHVKDPQRVVDEIARVLQPGGKLILTTRFVFPIHEAPFDFFRFTKYGLAHIFRKWMNVEIKTDTASFETIGILFERMAFQNDFRGSRFVTTACLLAAKFLPSLDRLVKRQYGDYKRKQKETGIIASGYYVIAYKP
jgi:SAM-dependent methyltransferase